MSDERQVSVFVLRDEAEDVELWSDTELVRQALSREAAVFEDFDSIGFNLDESHKFDVEVIESCSSLIEQIKQLVVQPRRSSLIVVSSQLITTNSGGAMEASEIANSIRAEFLAEEAVKHGHLCGLVGLIRSEPQRVKDIDTVVDSRSAELSDLRASVNRTADGLWMKAPRLRQHSLVDEDAIKVHVVNAREQLEECFQLRHDVYGLMGYLDDDIWSTPSRLEMDHFDLTSIHLAATDKITGDVVGTLRLVLQNVLRRGADSVIGPARDVLRRQQGWCREIAHDVTEDLFRRSLNQTLFMPLPILENSDFGERWPDFLDGNHTKFGGEISRVLVAPRYQGLDVSRLLMRVAIAIAFDLGKKFLLLECIPAHVKMYQKYGFVPLEGHHCRTQGLDQIAVGMRLDLDDSPYNPAVGLAKRHIRTLQQTPVDPDGLAGSKVLCLCSNRHCWQDGRYDSLGSAQCPLRDLFETTVPGISS